MKEHNTFRPSRYRCKLKFRYFCWPGAERNFIKLRFKQIYEALKMKGELSEWELSN